MRLAERLLIRADIREDESERVFLMFAYLLLIIASYMIVKAARDSLFVSTVGPSQLPYVYLAIAAAMGMVSSITSRAVQRIGLTSLVRMTSITAICNLALFWWGFRHHSTVLFYVLYVWVSVFGAITASQFWLLANYVFNAREARRLFGWIGAGGMIGGIVGGSSTKMIAPWFGTESLLLVCAGLVTVTVLLLSRIVHLIPAEIRGAAVAGAPRDVEAHSTRLFRQICRSRHLALLMLLLTISVIVEAVIDYQYKFSASHAFGSKDQLTAFFGSITAYIGLLSLIFQIALTGPILKRFGAGVAILFLPAGLLAASVALALRPALWTAAALQIIDGSIGYSIHRSGMELLYLPVPSRQKNAVKGFIDTFVDRTGRAIGGILLLVLTSVYLMTISQLSAVACIFLAVWLAGALLVRREYLQSFRSALEKKTIQPDALHVDLDDATITLLVGTLSSADERQILYALDLLSAVHPHHWRPQLARLVGHPSSTVRSRTLSVLARWNDRTATPLIADLLHDPDISVRAEAIRALGLHWDAFPQARAMLDNLLADPNIEVVRQGIRSSGSVQYEAAIPLLIRNLQSARLRPDASAALLQFGPNIVLPLVRTLQDGRQPVEVRRHIPKVLADTRQQRAADTLLDALHVFENELDYPMIKALNRMRLASNEIAFDAEKVLASIEQEREDYLRLRSVLRSFESNSLDGRSRAAATFSILVRAIRERLEQKVERIFRLLALIYPPHDVYAAYYTCVVKPAARPSAIEFLDNLVDVKTKPLVMPLFEEAFELRDESRTSAHMQRDAALRVLRKGADRWLQTIAADLTEKLRIAA